MHSLLNLRHFNHNPNWSTTDDLKIQLGNESTWLGNHSLFVYNILEMQIMLGLDELTDYVRKLSQKRWQTAVVMSSIQKLING